MNTLELLGDVKRAITVPDYQKRYNNDDMLRFAYNNLNSKVLQVLQQVAEEYNVKQVEVTHVAQQRYVDIPSYFVAQQVKNVAYKLQGDDGYRNLVRYELNERFTSINQPGQVRGFSFENDRLYLHPRPQDPGTILFFYRKKHPSLVLPTLTARIASATGNTITLTDTAPADFVAGAFVDVNKGKANYQNKIQYEEIASVTGSIVTMVNPVTDWDIVAGDELAIHNTTSIIQLPDEMHQVLVWAICVDIVKGLNIPDQIQFSEKEYQERVAAALDIMKPRSQDSLATIVQYNGALSRPTRRFPAVSI
jgi:hypothetical protein